MGLASHTCESLDDDEALDLCAWARLSFFCWFGLGLLTMTVKATWAGTRLGLVTRVHGDKR